MSSVVEICNRALQKLGAKRIVSLTEDTVNARHCNVAYVPVLRSELRAHSWNCAIKRVSIAADATEPIFGKANYFTLPSDFLRLIEQDPSELRNDLDWQIEGKKIVTNDDAPLEVRYIYEITDPNEIDASLAEALSAKLAVEMCEVITQSNSKKSSLIEEYDAAIKMAKRVNAIESIAAEPPMDTWESIRL